MVELFHVTTWLIANTTQILGTVVLILIPTCYLYWRNSIKRALRRKLQVRITRNPLKPAQLVDWSKDRPLLRFLELDQKVAAADFPHLPMISVGEYMASLDADGKISFQKALISIMERTGLSVALPLALFAPKRWTQETDVVSAFHNSPYAGLLVSNMLSTLGLISVSIVAQRQNIDAKKYTERARVLAAAAEITETAHNSAALPDSTNNNTNSNGKTEEKSKRKFNALELMVHGSNPNTDDGLSSRVLTPFHLVDDFPTATGSTITELLITTDQTPLPAPEPVLINELFPDLASGSGGCRMTKSEGQAKVNQVFAILCNKLGSNSLVGLGASSYEPKEVFTVHIPGHPTPVDSVEDLVDVLEKCGHTANIRIYANTTSFGVGLCVKEKDSTYTQIPLAYPLSTGLYAKDENGDDIDVVTLMQHAAMELHVSGPLITAQIEWCLSISGMTGWGPEQEIKRGWTRDESTRTWHAEEELSTAAGRRSALRLITASASALNVAASKDGLLLGGYGALGVCIDSVAAIQQCISGKCTLYPLILGGDAKMGLLSCYKFIRNLGKRNNKMNNTWKYDAEAEALVSALLELPCDGIVDPARAAQTAQRALSCLPERSVFAGVEECKKSLQAAIKAADTVLAMENTQI